MRLDLLRSTGLRYAIQRRREEERLSTLARDPGKSAYRVIWQEAADELGAELSVLSGEFFEIDDNGTRARVWRHWVPLDDAVTLRLALDKMAVHELLTRAGLPLPDHYEFDASELDGALDFITRTGSACVVKPTGGASGSGATTGVRTRDQLLRARLRAGRIGRRLLIEQQAEGDMYRFLFLDGELLDAVRRRPPRVTGDGRSTIRELIAAENATRLDPVHPVSMPILRVDLDCLFALEAAEPEPDRGQRDRPGADRARAGRGSPPGGGASRGAAGRGGFNNRRFEPITEGVRRRDNRGQRDTGASLPLPGRRRRQCHPCSGPHPPEAARRVKERTPA